MDAENKVREHMKLVDKYGEACDNFTLGAHSANSILAKADIEASFRAALAARPADGVAVPLDVRGAAIRVSEALRSESPREDIPIGSVERLVRFVEAIAATHAYHEQQPTRTSLPDEFWNLVEALRCQRTGDPVESAHMALEEYVGDLIYRVAQPAVDVDDLCGMLSKASEHCAMGEPKQVQNMLSMAIQYVRGVGAEHLLKQSK
jgi:hypothetical protein